MPFAIYVLGLTIFSMTTSEFMVAGMIDSLSKEFGVSVSAVGYLISGYAGAMVIGGPVLTVGLLNIPKKKALLALVTFFLIGQSLGALAWSYESMMVARIITGVASSAGFGVSLSICAGLVGPESRGRAASIVIGGLMVATVIGLPAATLIEQAFGWRTSFWVVVVLVLLSGIATQWLIPASPKPEPISLRGELAAFNNRSLWAAYATSSLIIGATFAAFSYFSPILTEVTGFAPTMVPFLLSLYGMATVIGNIITGRLADRYAMKILAGGLLLLTAGLITFALGAHNNVITIIAVIVIGIVGVPMNPAMATRVMRSAGTGPLVNTVHTSVITFGVMAGSMIGGLTISGGYGLVSPLWVGSLFGVLGLLSLLPYVREISQNESKSTKHRKYLNEDNKVVCSKT
ncbi:MFS transporter [Paenibacillus selenitireducens]|uniref:MFS transporter n=1 Tax=Paenibacillus selenitireducens TaxID=1324314 RepID=A0A1T2X174_9BACL|nr:MFS transporter [Paenibacillus selenitireducens]OPA73602.1 MFS transporter [Paenibacillus selenitireducens]